MNHTREKILEALNVIKDTCKDACNCETCPLRSENNDCYIGDKTPFDWNIMVTDDLWRAFR